MINYCLEKKTQIKKRYKLVVMVLASCTYNLIPINVLRLIARDILWFYVGYYFEPFREMINYSIHDKSILCILLSGVGFMIMSAVYFIIPNPDGINMLSAVSIIIKICCAAAGCVFIYCLSIWLSSTRLTKSKAFITLRSNAFGIYLYSDPWNYVVLAMLVHYIGSAVFVTNWGSAIMCFSRILVTGGMGLVMSSILKKLKIKYVC